MRHRPPSREGFQGTKRFRVLRRLGAGGMGIVYEVFDREREQTIALKTLLNVSAQAIYRLKREFRTLSDVVHPNLVMLHELFREDDTWFFTMKFVPGVDWLTYVRWGTPGTARRVQSEPGLSQASELDSVGPCPLLAEAPT